MYTLSYLKLISVFLSDLIVNNKIKIIAIILMIVSWNYADTYSDTKYEAKIVKEVVIGDNYLYLEEKISENKISYDIHQYSEPQKLKDNKIEWEEYSGYNIWWWILFVVGALFTFIPTIMGWFGEEDAGWCFSDSWREGSRSIIYCIEEDGIFYYMDLDRLIAKRDSQIRRDYIGNDFGIRSLRDILFCPKYQTKSQKRQNNLSKIGIN